MHQQGKTETGAKPVGKVVTGTVKGDVHDIGKNLVRMMLEGNGFEVLDLGMDTSPQKFVEAVDETVVIVGLSDLLGLERAMILVPVLNLAAVLLFYAGSRYYTSDLAKVDRVPVEVW